MAAVVSDFFLFSYELLRSGDKTTPAVLGTKRVAGAAVLMGMSGARPVYFHPAHDIGFFLHNMDMLFTLQLIDLQHFGNRFALLPGSHLLVYASFQVALEKKVFDIRKPLLYG